MHITVGKLQSIMELLFMPLHKKYYEDFDTGKPSILRLILGYMFLKSYLLSEVFKSNCDALRDLVPFVQFKKREKRPWMGC